MYMYTIFVAGGRYITIIVTLTAPEVSASLMMLCKSLLSLIKNNCEFQHSIDGQCAGPKELHMPGAV